MKQLRCLTSILMILLLVLSCYPTAALATEPESDPTDVEASYSDLSFPTVGSRTLTDAYLRGQGEQINRNDRSAATSAEPLPSSYYSSSITSTKQQIGGTCWAYAAIAAVEASMVKNGIGSYDLSENHVCRYVYADAYDKLGMLTGDSTTPLQNTTYLTRGGDYRMVAYAWMRGTGPVPESVLPSSNTNATASADVAYNHNVASVTDVIWISVYNRDAVKRAIMEYGAGTVSYYHDDSYMKTDSYYYPKKISTNHSVSVIGWDDNYSSTNFYYQPPTDGAWIIKNSNSPYIFYLSYCDPNTFEKDAAFYAVAASEPYDKRYQYDGTGNLQDYISLPNNSQISNVFTANSSEVLRAVALNTLDEATSYTLEIYKLPSNNRNPSSGTLVSSQTGTIDFPGYYTIPLTKTVPLSSGDLFSVVFTLSSGGSTVFVPYDCTKEWYDNPGGPHWARWVHRNHGDSSFYLSAGGSWEDCPEYGDFRIKAYTVQNLHEHDLELFSALAPDCTNNGHSAYYHCVDCNRYFSDANAEFEITLADTILLALGHKAGADVIENVLSPTCIEQGSYDVVTYCLRCSEELSREHNTTAATGIHTYRAWSSNQNGHHTGTCNVCGHTETTDCSYIDVVTAPTSTEQGYTTHTCTVCGYSFRDTFTDPLGSNYLISFSVPTNVTPVNSMTCGPNSTITLPIANAPTGYTFLGWVAASVSETTALPSEILTGSYQPADNITLYALYSFEQNVDKVVYERVRSYSSEVGWEGNYVISYNTAEDSMRVLRSVSTKTTASLSQSTYAQLLSTAGISFRQVDGQDILFDVDPKFQFSISLNSGSYRIWNKAKASYLGGTTVLYALTANYSRYLTWALSLKTDGTVLMKCKFKGNYLNYNTSQKYFTLSSSTNSNIYLWKQLPSPKTLPITFFTTSVD